MFKISKQMIIRVFNDISDWHVLQILCSPTKRLVTVTKQL